jgi:ribosomal protein S27AE
MIKFAYFSIIYKYIYYTCGIGKMTAEHLLQDTCGIGKMTAEHLKQDTCGIGKITAEHLLQECPIYDKQRRKIWPMTMPVKHGNVHNLRLTANYFIIIQVVV